MNTQTAETPGGNRSRRGRMTKAIAAIAFLALAAVLYFIPGGKAPDIEVLKEFVTEEFSREVLVTLPTVGPFDMSITKSVAYLLIALGILTVLAVVVNRVVATRPGRFQFAMEALYGLARDGIVGSVMKSGQETWFPYIAAVFVFILTSNLIGLLPLPFGTHHQPAFYAATSNLNVTIGLALCTFVFTHYAGVRKNGGLGYVKNWAPASAPPVLKQLIWFIHAISELFRLVSLSVRLFANMLAGHAILAVFFAMALLFQSYLAALVLQGGSLLIYMFEIFVAFIQAFIFAILSAVYIGGALDQDH